MDDTGGDSVRFGQGASLKEIEKRNVLAALERNRWKLSRAAGDLGITLRQMGYRVKKFGLEELVRDRKHALK
ncbi:MAG: helix-turn-helix domain-containing protein [Desulfomonile sp.]|nr:helix-turn-helix domain-containing protein [Desulfomonile sp.]